MTAPTRTRTGRTRPTRPTRPQLGAPTSLGSGSGRTEFAGSQLTCVGLGAPGLLGSGSGRTEFAGSGRTEFAGSGRTEFAGSRAAFAVRRPTSVVPRTTLRGDNA